MTESIDSILTSLNGISNTVWGVFILCVSMMMGWYGKTELAYYFAGVGSTLMGVKQDANHPNTRVNLTAKTPEVTGTEAN